MREYLKGDLYDVKPGYWRARRDWKKYAIVWDSARSSARIVETAGHRNQSLMRQGNRMKRFVHTSGSGLAVLVVLGIFSAAMGGCTTKARIPVAGIEVPVPNIPLPAVLRGENDLRSRSWTKAFDIFHARLAREYAYTEHKGIDWNALYASAAPEVAAAQAEKNPDGWYLALRKYLHSIPDGNIQFDSNDVMRGEAEGATSGLALAQLSDGSVIVCGTVPGSPAEKSGIQFGATVLEWNGKRIEAALAETSVFWSDAPAATPAGRRLQQLMWLPRGGAGESCEIVFKNPGAQEKVTAKIAYAFDDFATLALARPLWKPVELFASPIESRPLKGELRYIRVAAIAPTFSTPFPTRDFRAAVKAATDARAKGIILDLRGTQGGDAGLVPKFLSSFVSTPAFYETPSSWDSELEAFLVESEDTVEIEPQLPAYQGRIAVLVDAYTMGPAESMAKFLQGRDKVVIAGDAGTYGSPGTPNLEITLPGGYVAYLPDRRSLDRAGKIQGAADAKGNGAVQPEAPITIDLGNAPALYQQHKDIVLEKVQEILGAAN